LEYFVLWTTVVLTALLVSIVVFTLLRRVLNDRTDRKMRRIQTLETITPADYHYFERHLRNEISTTEPVDVSRYRAMADQSGFADYLRARVERKRRWKRTLAVRTLSYLRNPRDVPLFRKVLREETFHPCVYAAGLGLALCGDIESLREILKKVYHKEVPNRDLLLSVLYPFGKGAAPAMHRLLDEEFLPVIEACVLVALLAMFRYREATPTLERMLERSKSVEIKIHVTEALGLIGDENTRRLLLPLREDKDFRVRLKAANSLGLLGGKKEIPEIEKFMRDENWWVRRNAAETLYNIGQAGRECLKRIAASEEPGPRSSAKLILEEMRFNRTRWRQRYAGSAA